MKLSDFLTYRTKCPVCDGENMKLHMGLFASAKEHINNRCEEDRLIVIKNMRGLNKGDKSYRAGYSFGFDDNSIYIDFANADGIKFDKSVPVEILPKFRAMDKNIGNHVLTKSCISCNRYSYSSNTFVLDYKKSIIDFKVSKEFFGLAKFIKFEKYKIYVINNDYGRNQTAIECSTASSDYYASFHNWLTPSLKLEVPIMKFTTADEMAERLDKLIVFS